MELRSHMNLILFISKKFRLQKFFEEAQKPDLNLRRIL